MNEITVEDRDQEKRILWLAVDKYYPRLAHERYMMGIVHVRITAPLTDLERQLDYIQRGRYGYVIMVLSEGALLSMLDDDYHHAIHAIIEAVIANSIPHTILINDYLFEGKEFSILKKDYIVNYIRFKEYKIHSSFIFDLIESRYPSGKRDVFRWFLSEYLENMVILTHDMGWEELLNTILSCELYKKLLTKQERGILAATVNDAFFFNWRKAEEYRREMIQNESINYVSDREYVMGLRADADLEEVFFANTFDPYSDPEPEDYLKKEELFTGIRENIALQRPVWKKIHTYAKRYCKERKTVDSTRTMVNTLSNKMFYAFLSEIGRIPDDNEKEQASTRVAGILAQVKENKDANVMPFGETDELFSYVESVLGRESHTVFRQYILQDSLWADELDRYLKMFQDYMASVRNIRISIDCERTDGGILYVINSSSAEVMESNFYTYANAFDEFMQYVEADQREAARVIVDRYNISEARAEKIVREYHRKCDQIRRDMRYDYQRKMLDIKEDLERGLADEVDSLALQAEMRERENQITELISHYDSILAMSRGFLDGEENGALRAIAGDYQYTDSEKELCDLFLQYDPNPQLLTNDLNIARDEHTPKNKRIEAAMRIMQFLGRYEREIGEEKTVQLLHHIAALKCDRVSIKRR